MRSIYTRLNEEARRNETQLLPPGAARKGRGRALRRQKMERMGSQVRLSELRYFMVFYCSEQKQINFLSNYFRFHILLKPCGTSMKTGHMSSLKPSLGIPRSKDQPFLQINH